MIWEMSVVISNLSHSASCKVRLTNSIRFLFTGTQFVYNISKAVGKNLGGTAVWGNGFEPTPGT